jgi:hypothetical protein
VGGDMSVEEILGGWVCDDFRLPVGMAGCMNKVRLRYRKSRQFENFEVLYVMCELFLPAPAGILSNIEKHTAR